MSEAVYQEVERAIREKLHVGVFVKGRWPSPWTWCYPDHIENGNIIMRDSDCGLAKPTFSWTTDEWAARVNSGGLWRQVGMWDFVRAEDAAADDIRYAHSNPEGAGRRLVEYRETTQSLRAQIAEYRSAITALDCWMEKHDPKASSDYWRWRHRYHAIVNDARGDHE